MQERMMDGSYGEPRPYNSAQMEESLKNPDVSHVEIFEARDKELKRRHALHQNQQIEAARRTTRKKKNKHAKKSRRK